ncbi:MAG: type III pantothenate kinase [Planctomycetes bacterium]|nr:type III pantothenate kinase [Planctomycetota bacterium]
MNIIAVDIGNTNISIALFLRDEQRTIDSIAGESTDALTQCLKTACQDIPIVGGSKEGKRDIFVVVSSVKPVWTKKIAKIVKDELGEKIQVIGKDVPLPMTLWVDEPEKVGTDRIVSSFAAYSVAEEAVVVADFGTAVTIDLVDDNGVFQGGVIVPGFEISAKALKENAALLPKVKVTRPEEAYGKNTKDAINCGLYYSTIGMLEEVIRRFAETIGKWPRTVLTGAAAKIIQEDCQFIDSFVPNLVVKGIALTFQKYIEEQTE